MTPTPETDAKAIPYFAISMKLFYYICLWTLLVLLSPIVLVIWLVIKIGDFIKALDDLEQYLRRNINER